MALTEGHGVDAIIEMAAHLNLAEDLRMLARRGRVVVVGSRGRIEINRRDTMSRDAAILGMSLMHLSPEENAKHLDELEAQIGSKLGTYDQAIAGIVNTLRELMKPPVPKHRGIGFTAGIKRSK